HHDDRCDTHSPHGFTPFPRKGFEASAPDRSPDSWIFATVPPSHPCNTDSGSAERNGTVLPTYSGGTVPASAFTEASPASLDPGYSQLRAVPLTSPADPTLPRVVAKPRLTPVSGTASGGCSRRASPGPRSWPARDGCKQRPP